MDECIPSTAAQTLRATVRLTNVQFTDALLYPTSQEYLNLSRSIEEEVQGNGCFDTCFLNVVIVLTNSRSMEYINDVKTPTHVL